MSEDILAREILLKSVQILQYLATRKEHYTYLEWQEIRRMSLELVLNSDKAIEEIELSKGLDICLNSKPANAGLPLSPPL